MDQTATPEVEGETVAQPVESEQKGDAQAETAEQPKAKPETPEWAERRFQKLTQQKYEARAQAEMARQRAAELEARLATYEGQPQQQPQEVDVQRMAEQIAEQKFRSQAFDQKANSVVEQGKSLFKDDFAGAVKNLQLMGALFDERGAPTEFAESVMDYDKPAVLMHHLGTHPDEAERILGLSARGQARELTKLEIRLGQKQEPPVSNAPAPISSEKTVSTPATPKPGSSNYIDWKLKQLRGR
jgi:hypothetical protein